MIDTSQVIDDIIATYPNGMFRADVLFELESHGLSAFSALVVARKILGKREHAETMDIVCEIAGEIWSRDREGRRKELISKIGDALVVEFSDGFWRLIVHPSTRRKGKWQVSRLDSHGPWGHVDYDDFEGACAACVGAHKSSMMDEGNSKFNLVQTAGKRT